MNKIIIILLLTLSFVNCKNTTENKGKQSMELQVPNDMPIEFKENLTPQNKIIHKGILTPDLKEFYYTISNENYENFEVYVIKKDKSGNWSVPEEAFFNSKYDDHGMSFTFDGNTVYFSSTRPVNIDGIQPTWHLWRSDKVNGVWSESTYVDIPNLRDKLVSHPSITNSGTLYFHSSNLDYSEMDIYQSKKANGKFDDAEKVLISLDSDNGKCTPHVSPNGDYLIFASIEDQLDLMICYNNGKGGWTNTKILNKEINAFGQGNPYVTPDNKYLFYTTNEQENWQVKWVNIEAYISQ